MIHLALVCQSSWTAGCWTNSSAFNLTLHIMPVYCTKSNGWKNPSKTPWWKRISPLKFHPAFSSLQKVWWPIYNVLMFNMQTTTSFHHSWIWLLNKAAPHGKPRLGISTLSDLHYNYHSICSFIPSGSVVYENFIQFNQLFCIKWV